MPGLEQDSQTFHRRSVTFLLRSGIITVFLFLIGFGLMQFLSKRKRAPRRVRPPALTTRVSTTIVRKTSRLLYIESFGTAQATQQVRVVSEISGIIRATLPDFKPGRLVKKGELLVRIDSQAYMIEYRRLLAQQNSLKKQIVLGDKALALDRRTLRRNEQLLRRKSLDENTVDQNRLRVREREQRQESLRQSLAITAMQIQNALLQLRRSRIRSPFAARVVSGGVDVGNYAVQGQTIATLESIDSVDIPVAVPQHVLLNITDQQNQYVSPRRVPHLLQTLPPAEVSIGGNPKMRWEGRVVRVGGQLDTRTRTIDLWVRVKLTPQTGDALLSGSYCQVRIPYRRMQDAIELPRQALYGDKVYLVEQGRLQPRRVTVIHRGADTVVIGSGLQGGEHVVTSYMLQPIQGMKVLVEREALE